MLELVQADSPVTPSQRKEKSSPKGEQEEERKEKLGPVPPWRKL